MMTMTRRRRRRKKTKKKKQRRRPYDHSLCPRWTGACTDDKNRSV